MRDFASSALQKSVLLVKCALVEKQPKALLLSVTKAQQLAACLNNAALNKIKVLINVETKVHQPRRWLSNSFINTLRSFNRPSSVNLQISEIIMF